MLLVDGKPGAKKEKKVRTNNIKVEKKKKKKKFNRAFGKRTV